MVKILLDLGLTKLFILAIFFRLLIMPFYFHPDIKTYHFQSSFLKEGVFNIYTYLIEKRESLPIKEEFVYFPLTYFFLGTYQILVTPILGNDFSNWLSDASEEARERIGTFRYLFILKIPYLILDLIIPFLLINFFIDKKQKRDIFLLWLFNPVSISIIYIFSNLDIIPVTLSLLSVILFRKKKILLSGLILGLAAGFKAYPLLFLPFFLLFIREFKESLKFILITLGTLILITLPFWSNAFLKSAFISGLTTRIAFPGIEIGFGEALMVSVVSLSILFFWSWTEVNQKKEQVWPYILFVLLLMFSSIHYHIQWLLWIMPFLVIFYVLQSRLRWLGFLWINLAFIIPLLYDDKSMSISLLSAISPLYNLLPTPFFVLQHIYDPFLIQGIIHSAMFGISIVLILRSLRYLKG